MSYKVPKLTSVVIVLITAASFYFFLLSKTPTKTAVAQTEEFQKACKLDVDCQKHIVAKACSIFCTNHNAVNNEIIESMEQTCDPALWDPPGADCGCLSNQCTILSYY